MTETPTAPGPTQTGIEYANLGHLLIGLVRRPQRLLLVWNWKSALLSVMFRGPIFFTAALSKGFGAAFSALLIETLICALGVGLYNALVQTLRNGRPLWLTGLLISVVFPGCVQTVEYLVHRAHGTPHLRVAAIVSLCVSAISTLFNWYAMRNGALLVGNGSRGLLSDIRHVPKLILGFVTLLPRYLYGKLSGKDLGVRQGRAESVRG